MPEDDSAQLGEDAAVKNPATAMLPLPEYGALSPLQAIVLDLVYLGKLWGDGRDDDIAFAYYTVLQIIKARVTGKLTIAPASSDAREVSAWVREFTMQPSGTSGADSTAATKTQTP